MAASLWWTLLSLHFLVSASEVKINITAESGRTVTLPCRAPRNTGVLVVEWTRPDLNKEYVFLYRDGQSDPDHQNPSFMDRAELKDSQMKAGDLSLSLKDVTINDRGTYECHVLERGTNRRKRSFLETQPINIINLLVYQSDIHTGDGGNKDGENKDGENKDGEYKDGGNKDANSRGHTGLVVGLPVIFVLHGFIFGIVMTFKRHTKKNSHLPPADDASGKQLA